KLVNGAIVGVDLQPDAVEVAVDRGGKRSLSQPTRSLHRAGVYPTHANFGERRPKRLIAQRSQDRLSIPSDDRSGVGGKPDRGARSSRAWTRCGIGSPPKFTAPGVMLR